MHLCYFDESKHSKENPNFFIGGLLIPDQKALDFEKTLGQIAFKETLNKPRHRGVPAT